MTSIDPSTDSTGASHPTLDSGASGMSPSHSPHGRARPIRHLAIALAAVVAPLGYALAQDAPPNREAWVKKENAATDAMQRQAEAERIQSAAKVCSKAATYWAQRNMPFDVDACLRDPRAAQNKVTADQNARREADYQAQQAEYTRQQAEYQRQLAEYQRRLAEYDRQSTHSSSSSAPSASPPELK